MGRKLKPEEVYERLGVRPNHFSQMVFRGQAPPRIMVSPRKWLIDEDVLEAWLASRQEPARDEVSA